MLCNLVYLGIKLFQRIILKLHPGIYLGHEFGEQIFKCRLSLGLILELGLLVGKGLLWVVKSGWFKIGLWLSGLLIIFP